ncbi:Uma2 family endonuclease [Streptomyces sp. HNM0574]|uniref:Uma2 family endonuclease n=1 Tax=Streptomyces sp. HNM0574 TaxID=2714954 RepID=UPI00146C834C|nr:Uma2 family endonuclease [Streptomyces sp. HNM0574]NLU69136.1 Uma2 family endonuclease [Streptomyces sp. HNM0574]
MTAVDDRTVTVFGQLAVPEGFRAELLRGEIRITAEADRVHNGIARSVSDRIPSRWDRLQAQDIAVPGEASEPQPDLVVLEPEAFQGRGRLIPSPALSLVVEVVSKSSVHRDRLVKRSVYAAGQIPAYLIVDPLAAVCVLLTEPSGAGERADYRVERTSAFGLPVPLESLGITLDTTDFPTLT